MQHGIEFQIRASRAPMSFGGDTIELFALQKGDGGNYVAEPLTLKQHEQALRVNAFCTIDNAQAQVLIDDLWSAGLRPSEGSGSAGAMKAVQNHLADMKAILFHKIGIEKGAKH